MLSRGFLFIESFVELLFDLYYNQFYKLTLEDVEILFKLSDCNI